MTKHTKDIEGQLMENLVKIREYSIRPSGLRAYSIYVPTLWLRDNSKDAGDYIYLYYEEDGIAAYKINEDKAKPYDRRYKLRTGWNGTIISIPRKYMRANDMFVGTVIGLYQRPNDPNLYVRKIRDETKK